MPLRADPRCSSDAGWEPAGGTVPAPRFARPRAGCRSAQDLVFTPSFSLAPGSLGADGGTVGGSARIRAVGCSVAAGAGCSWKSLRFTPWTGLFVSVWSRTWTFQFLTVMAVGLVGEVFKVHAQDRIQQRFMEQNTLTFQFLKIVVEVEVFSVYAQIRIQLLHPRTRLVLRMSFLQGVFALFPRGKSARLGPHSGSELIADFTSWTRAHGARASAGGGVRGGVP